MANEQVIINLNQQIKYVADRIGSLAEGIVAMEGNDAICEDYENFLFDEVAHLQVLTLEITQAVTDGEQMEADEAFMEGELVSEQEDEEDVAAETAPEEPPKEEEK